MSLKIISVFIFVLIMLQSCSSSKKLSSEPEAKIPGTFLQNIIIDGKAAEWEQVPHDFSPYSTFQYSVANSNDNLYILIKVPGQIEQMKLLQGGVEIWLDPNGAKNKNTAVYYPVKGELGEMESLVKPGERTNPKEMRLRVTGQLISMNRVGFKAQYSGVQSIHQNTGFKAALNWDENDVLVYELTIPFNAFVENIKRDNIDIGFILQGVDRPKNPPAGTNMNPDNGAGGMGSHRANFGNRRSPQQLANDRNNNKKEKLYVEEDFWAQYSIATGK